MPLNPPSRTSPPPPESLPCTLVRLPVCLQVTPTATKCLRLTRTANLSSKRACCALYCQHLPRARAHHSQEGSCSPSLPGPSLSPRGWRQQHKQQARMRKSLTLSQDSVHKPDVSGETRQPCYSALSPHQPQTPRPSSLGIELSQGTGGQGQQVPLGHIRAPSLYKGHSLLCQHLLVPVLSCLLPRGVCCGSPTSQSCFGNSYVCLRVWLLPAVA